MRQFKNGNLLVLQGNKIVELDMLGNRIREWTALGEKTKSSLSRAVATRAFHHDVFPLDNGNLLALGLELRTFDGYPTSETDADAPTERANVVGDLVVEFADDGTIVNKWSLLDMLDPYRIGFGSLGDRWDKQLGTRKTVGVCIAVIGLRACIGSSRRISATIAVFRFNVAFPLSAAKQVDYRFHRGRAIRCVIQVRRRRACVVVFWVRLDSR